VHKMVSCLKGAEMGVEGGIVGLMSESDLIGLMREDPERLGSACHVDSLHLHLQFWF
jgi:hypothetical protein